MQKLNRGEPQSTFKALLVGFFSKKLDFRVRLFNVLATVGVLVSFLSAIVSIVMRDPVREVGLYIAFGLLSAGLIAYSTITEQYQRCYKITIAAVFLVGFPLFFWVGSGYYGPMPQFFVFAVAFTVFMLEGASAVWMSMLELAVYVCICICAYSYFPVGRVVMDSKRMLIETIFGFVVVSAALGSAMLIHFRLYNKQQRELETAREEALKLSEVKNTFLANMSHEIRTPINVMLGMTEMVLRDSYDEAVSDYARKIQNAGNMLLMLVSNILDVSKIESGKLELSDDRYRTAVLIQELCEMGAESARRKGLAFSLRADERLPSELWGDIARIKQIVANFLGNAAKYTNAGSITLDFGLMECASDGEIMLRISISDTGIGIKTENLPILFNAFTRLDLPAHRSIEGTGLGLAIAKDLTERMNGHIYVKSVYGEGSEFWVEIPQKVIDDKPVGDWQFANTVSPDGQYESFTAPDALILVVDDNAENLQTAKALLRRTLSRVDLAESGTACLEAVRKTEYNIILMDYMMPDMDGVETFRRLREQHPEFKTPVIALTANAVSGTEERLRGEGFAAYITKPVQAQRLEGILAEHLPPHLVAKRTIYPQKWISLELKDAMSRALNMCGVSLEDGLKNAGGDMLLFARMAEVFTHRYPASLSRMKAAFPDSSATVDFGDLRHLVHSLKSSAGFVGADDLSHIARRAERGCEDGDFNVLALAMPLLYMEWARAEQGLQTFAAHMRAIKPLAEPEQDARSFSPDRLAGHIERRARRMAIQELDLFIAGKGDECPASLLKAKQALMELDFDTAKRLISESGEWEEAQHG